MTPREHDEIDELAGEYVSGTLSPATMAGIERRLRTDSALRMAVARRRERTRTDDLRSATTSGRSNDRPARRTLSPARLWNSPSFWRWLSAALAALITVLIVLIR